jgi:hypothetical protein
MAMDVLARRGDLRLLERYRDSLWPGTAEREGAEEMVRQARAALDEALADLAGQAPGSDRMDAVEVEATG